MKIKPKKRIFTLLLALMLTLSVCYFAVLPSTTAWVVDVGEAAGAYKMAQITATYPEGASDNVSLDFKASTRFADDNERENYFEHTVQFFEFSVANTGNIDARVYFDVMKYNSNNQTTSDLDETLGLRYFWFPIDSTVIESGTVTEFVSGVYENAAGKRVLPAQGGGYYSLNPTLTSALEAKMLAPPAPLAAVATLSGGKTVANSAFAASDASGREAQTAFLAACNDGYIELPADGQPVNICMAFWVEYDYFAQQLTSAVDEINYDVKIQVLPVQDDYYAG